MQSATKALLFLFVLLPGAHARGVPGADEILRLTITSDRADYAVREPVRVRLVIRNVSQDTVRIAGPRTLDPFEPEMSDWLYFQIEYPDGHVENRRVSFVMSNSIPIYSYRGIPFAPGDSAQVYLYPASTNRKLDAAGELQVRFRPQSANALYLYPPGEYGVRVCYRVTKGYTHLYIHGQRRACSNRIRLHVHAPDAAEREILDAIYRCVAMPVEVSRVAKTDDFRPLETVIRKYPAHRMSLYARYCLGIANISRGIVRSRPDDFQEAIKLLRRLSQEHPGYYREQVSLEVAAAYYFAATSFGDERQAKRARSTIRTLMEEEPGLWASERFVTMFLSCAALEGATYVASRRNVLNDRYYQLLGMHGLSGITSDKLLVQENE